VKNIVLCFDRTSEQPGSRDATNAEALFRLLGETEGQIGWYHSGARTPPASSNGRFATLGWRAAAAEEARATVAEAYRFLINRWQPGDRIYLFGVGRGAYCARELARLLGIIGIVAHRTDHLLDHALASYVLPRTRRTPQDWSRVNQLVARLSGYHEIAVPVQYLGLWDILRMPGLPHSSTAEPLHNVVAGRHAVAIDGGRFSEHPTAQRPDEVDEVWFRGAHCDVAGGSGACWSLADIALDWILDGAVRAGALLRDGSRYTAPAPSALDALAGSAHIMSLRRLPADARVHASVDLYLHAHPQYWRRLPNRVVWADGDWLARSERLVPAANQSIPSARVVEPAMLTAAAS
jgi:uncharacterized protein (DUF2235 family)